MTDGPGPLEVPATAEHLDEILDLITTVATDAGVSQDALIRFQSAAMEVVENIIEHGAANVVTQMVITLEAVEGWFRGAIEDDGPPLSVDLRSLEMPDEMAEGGRGLAMAAALLDDFRYDRRQGFNLWRLGVALPA